MTEKPSRIAVAMSGGLDSSVAALLLARAGHEVLGLSLRLYDPGHGEAGRCCTPEDLADARRVAAAVGFPHYVLDFEERFREAVLVPFVAEYLAGRTPIPCVACNSTIKFADLLARAAAYGCEQLATGHYARVTFDVPAGRWRLWRARDASKDQSYFLFELGQATLARVLFPLGEMDKGTVREIARAAALPVAEKAESMDICFVPRGEHFSDVVEREIARDPERYSAATAGPGQVVDGAGTVVGTHAGAWRYTVGQRKGLGVAAGKPMYVVATEPGRGRVVLGEERDLYAPRLAAERVSWVAGVPPETPRRLEVKLRHRHLAAPALVTPISGAAAEVLFDIPQRAVTPGQAAVFYDGDEVIGGGWIASAR